MNGKIQQLRQFCLQLTTASFKMSADIDYIYAYIYAFGFGADSENLSTAPTKTTLRATPST